MVTEFITMAPMSKLRIRNVRLSSKDNRSYRERCAYHATIRRIESGEREADTRRHVTAWAEQVACRIIAQQHEQDRRNIISWEELNVYGHYASKHKETTGTSHVVKCGRRGFP